MAKSDPAQSAESPVEDSSQSSEKSLEEVSFEKWEGFVKFMEESSNKSLVSLLRNSVLLEITEDEVVIAFKNTRIFSDAKRKQIEEAARSYFNPSIRVVYKETSDGTTGSVRKKLESEREKEIKIRKEEARKNRRVKELLNLFPGSRITDVTILEESKDD